MLHCNVVSHWLDAYTKWSLDVWVRLLVHATTSFTQNLWHLCLPSAGIKPARTILEAQRRMNSCLSHSKWYIGCPDIAICHCRHKVWMCSKLWHKGCGGYCNCCCHLIKAQQKQMSCRGCSWNWCTMVGQWWPCNKCVLLQTWGAFQKHFWALKYKSS